MISGKKAAAEGQGSAYFSTRMVFKFIASHSRTLLKAEMEIYLPSTLKLGLVLNGKFALFFLSQSYFLGLPTTGKCNGKKKKIVMTIPDDEECSFLRFDGNWKRKFFVFRGWKFFNYNCHILDLCFEFARYLLSTMTAEHFTCLLGNSVKVWWKPEVTLNISTAIKWFGSTRVKPFPVVFSQTTPKASLTKWI